MRVFYAAGPGDIIAAHGHWRRGEHDPSEVSITFSSQVADFCQRRDAPARFVSYHERREVVRDGRFVVEHRPRPFEERGGLLYHVGQLAYGFRLWLSALRFGADVAIIDSGTTHPFFLSLFALSGMKVVPVLYNALWPHGSPPTRPVPRLVSRLDALFWRFVPLATLCISPECARQVESLAGPRGRPLHQVRAQFRRDYFEKIPPPPPHDERPFRILYVGRIHESKGVLDLLEVAERLESERPGQVHFEVCGRGPALEEMARRREERRLEGAVTLHGWTSLEDLRRVYARCHAAIVPTRSTFVEGLAMTAAEAALAGRPVITSPVVPALELLRPACAEASTDDVASYVAAIRRLRDDGALHARLRAACPEVSAQFTDPRLGVAAVLGRVLP